LFSTENYILKPGERKLIKTNISCAIPEWYYGRIAPRSGMAFKYGVNTLAGVIDSWYRWDIGVLLINFWEENHEIKIWHRIAQFIIEKCHYVDWVESDDLGSTVRDVWWFGSSGQ
jgi:dUTP pyrophosphatase